MATEHLAQTSEAEFPLKLRIREDYPFIIIEGMVSTLLAELYEVYNARVYAMRF